MEQSRDSDQGPGWLVRSPRRLQMAVYVLVGAVSLLGVYGIENAEMRRRHATLERNAADIAASLRNLDTEHEIYLRASAALLQAHDPVTAQDFNQLQSQLNFDRYRQGALGVGWAPRVRADNDPRDAFPIAFLDPPAPKNAAAVGYDGYSEPARRAAMDQAAAIHAPVATGPIELIQDNGRAPQAGFLIYMPVFDQPVLPQAASLRGPLRGYVFMPFRARAVLAIANQLSADDNISVAAYDGKVAPDRLMAWLGNPADAGARLVTQVQMGNRPWQLVVSAPRPVGLSRLSQITILSGLVVALLLAVLIRMTYHQINEERYLMERKASEAGIRNALTRELNHRVKNTLATVLSIVTLTRRRETDLDSYVTSLSGRIRALSATHDLLTSNDWSSIELRQIIVAELSPYIGANDNHVSLNGPDLRLSPNDSLTLGLAVHELATNAAKYGALSALTGRINICWQKLNEQLVEIHWQETGGPVVTEPSKRGFGRELIEKILALELNSPVSLDFAPDGVQCVLRVPLRRPGSFVLRTQQHLPAPP